MVTYVVAAIGALIALLGVAIVIVPAPFRQIASWFETPAAIYGALAGRILIGAFFVFVSEACSWPMAIGTIGVIALVAGFFGLFIGIERTRALVGWFLGVSDTAVRAWGVVAVLFGAFIVYAAV